MKTIVLMASPRKKGNTYQILDKFIDEANLLQEESKIIWLYDKEIKSCIACRNCQKDFTIFGCIHKDDVQGIFDEILNSDIIILATPIYSWYSTAPLKALLDRLVYGMNKFYGEERWPSLWSGKKLGIISTCGYPVEKGFDLFEEGIKRYTKYSQLEFVGSLVEHDKGYKSIFMDKNKEERAREFARKLYK